ncbi:MAG: DUF2125 domain-containing protein [Rhizobiaceae bacterium]
MPSTADQKKTPNFARRIKWLGIATAVIFALYSAVWFYIANEGKRRVDTALIQLTQSGTPVTCEQSEIKGYPFRLGLFCKSLSLAQPQKGLALSAGSLRSAAQVYDPRHVIIELDGPASLDAPGLEPLTLNWKALRTSARVMQPLPQRISIESEGLQVAVRGPAGADTKILDADYASGHMRTEDANVAFAGEGGGVVIDPVATKGRTIPEFAASYDAVLDNGVAVLVDRPKSVRGLSGTIRQSQVIFKDGGTLKVSGPIKVDAEGLMDADLTITIADATKLGLALSKAAPEVANVINTTMATVAMANGAGKEAKIDVKIRKGKVSTGIFPLGNIPPLQ